MSAKKTLFLCLSLPFVVTIIFRLMTASGGAAFVSQTPRIVVQLIDGRTRTPLSKGLIKVSWMKDPNHPLVLLMLGGGASSTYREEYVITNSSGIAEIPPVRSTHYLSQFSGQSVEIYHPLFRYEVIWSPVKYGGKIVPNPERRTSWVKNKPISWIKLNGGDSLSLSVELREFSAVDGVSVYQQQREFAKNYFHVIESRSFLDISEMQAWKNYCIKYFDSVVALILPSEEQSYWKGKNAF